MADETYQPNVYREQGGNKLVVASGGEIEIQSGGTLDVQDGATFAPRVQELTASGAVTAGVQSVELNHASTPVAATIADATAHQGLLVVKDTSASGTAAHTLTLTGGTFNGTNTIATLNAPNECLIVYIDSAGDGTIVENVGSVGLSGP